MVGMVLYSQLSFSLIQLEKSPLRALPSDHSGKYLVDELRVMKHLPHENFIVLYNCYLEGTMNPWGKNELVLLIVMEWATMDLENLIKAKKKLSIHEVRKILVDVLMALYFIYFNEVFHCEVMRRVPYSLEKVQIDRYGNCYDLSKPISKSENRFWSLIEIDSFPVRQRLMLGGYKWVFIPHKLLLCWNDALINDGCILQKGD